MAWSWKFSVQGVPTIKMRLKARTIVTKIKLRSKILKVNRHSVSDLRWKRLFIRAQTNLCQQLPPAYKEKFADFHKLIEIKIVENSIGPDIINMDEVPLMFDLLLTRTVVICNSENNWPWENAFTCVLSCTASKKLLPMVIFKWMTMPKRKIPKRC